MMTKAKIAAFLLFSTLLSAGAAQAATRGKLVLADKPLTLPKGKWVSVEGLAAKSKQAGGSLTRHDVFRLLEKNKIRFDLAVAKGSGTLYIQPNVKVYSFSPFGYQLENASLSVVGADGKGTKQIDTRQVGDPAKFLATKGTSTIKRALKSGDYMGGQGEYWFSENGSTVGFGQTFTVQNRFFVRVK